MSLPPVERELQRLSPRYTVGGRGVVAIGCVCLGLLLLPGARRTAGARRLPALAAMAYPWAARLRRWFFGARPGLAPANPAGQRTRVFEASRMRRPSAASGDGTDPLGRRIPAGADVAGRQVRVSQPVSGDRLWVEVTWTAQPVPTGTAGAVVLT